MDTEDEKQLEHLKMIQAVVERMAQNSFMIKGWSVTLASALFALATAEHQKEFVYLAIVPVVAFWLIDGYYLRQERLFRAVYDRARGISKDDFTADPYFLTPTETDGENAAYWSSFSTPGWLFHGAIAAGIGLTCWVLSG